MRLIIRCNYSRYDLVVKMLRRKPNAIYTRQPKIGNNEWWLQKSRGSQAWSTAQDSESCPAEVREFKSRPLHLKTFYVLV